MSSKKIIAIDFGSTKIVTANFDNSGIAKIIIDPEENRMLLNCLAFTDQQHLIGPSAVYQASVNAQNTIRGSDLKLILHSNRPQNLSPIRFRHDNNQRPTIVFKYLNREEYAYLEQLIAILLTKVKKNSESFLNSQVQRCIITVPCFYTTHHRNVMIDASKIAGFDDIQIINDTTASAITYAIEKNISDARHYVLILDVGATSTEASIALIHGQSVRIELSNGEIDLGGDNFVTLLVHHFIKEFYKVKGVDLKNNLSAVVRLHTGCEELKKILSSAKNAKVSIEAFYNGESYDLLMSRDTFDSICEGICNGIINIVITLLARARVHKRDIQKIILAGGGTRLVKLQNDLKTIFEEAQLSRVLNQDEAIAKGAAYYSTGRLTLEERNMLQTTNDVLKASVDIQEMQKFLRKIDADEQNLTKFHKKMNELEALCYKTKREVNTRELENLEKEKILRECNDILQWIRNATLDDDSLQKIQQKHERLTNVNYNVSKKPTDMPVYTKEPQRNKSHSKKVSSGVSGTYGRSYQEKYKKAVTFFNEHQYQLAAKIFTELLKSRTDQELKNLFIYRGQCYFQTKQYQLCLNDIKKIPLQELTPQLKKCLDTAELTLYKNAAEIAIQEAKKISNSSDNATLALSLLDDAIAKKPVQVNNENIRITSKLYHQKAILNFILKNYHDAITNTYENMKLVHKEPSLQPQRNEMYKEISGYLEKISDDDRVKFVMKCLKDTQPKKHLICTIL